MILPIDDKAHLLLDQKRHVRITNKLIRCRFRQIQPFGPSESEFTYRNRNWKPFSVYFVTNRSCLQCDRLYNATLSHVISEQLRRRYLTLLQHLKLI